MPRIKSAIKNNRKNIRRNAINRARRSALRTEIKKMRRLLAQKDGAAARKGLSGAVSTLDRAVSKGVLHRNAAARYKSRMMKRLQGLEKAR